MLYIYTSLEEAKKTGKNIVKDIEAQYILRYKSIVEKCKNNEGAFKILEIVEGMKEYLGDMIDAKFGKVSMKYISTGGKGCLLAYLYNSEFIVSTDELGYNCIYLLCELSKTTDIYLLTSCEYTSLPSDVTACINGQIYEEDDIVEALEDIYG